MLQLVQGSGTGSRGLSGTEDPVRSSQAEPQALGSGHSGGDVHRTLEEDDVDYWPDYEPDIEFVRVTLPATKREYDDVERCGFCTRPTVFTERGWQCLTCEKAVARNGKCKKCKTSPLCGTGTFCYICTPRRVLTHRRDQIIVVLVDPYGLEREVLRTVNQQLRATGTDDTGKLWHTKSWVTQSLLQQGCLVLNTKEFSWKLASLL
jgi:hypothetical protein